MSGDFERWQEAEQKLNDLDDRRARDRARRLEIIAAEYERVALIMGWAE